MTEMIPVDHPGHASPAKYFADVLARSLCRETRARAWCEETSAYAPIKQKRCPVSLPGKRSEARSEAHVERAASSAQGEA